MKDSNIPLATPIFNIIFNVVGLRGELSLVESFLTEMEKLNFKVMQISFGYLLCRQMSTR